MSALDLPARPPCGTRLGAVQCTCAALTSLQRLDCAGRRGFWIAAETGAAFPTHAERTALIAAAERTRGYLYAGALRRAIRQCMTAPAPQVGEQRALFEAA